MGGGGGINKAELGYSFGGGGTDPQGLGYSLGGGGGGGGSNKDWDTTSRGGGMNKDWNITREREREEGALGGVRGGGGGGGDKGRRRGSFGGKRGVTHALVYYGASVTHGLLRRRTGGVGGGEETGGAGVSGNRFSVSCAVGLGRGGGGVEGRSGKERERGVEAREA